MGPTPKSNLTTNLNDVLALNAQIEDETRLAIAHVTGRRTLTCSDKFRGHMTFFPDGSKIFSFDGVQLVIFEKVVSNVYTTPTGKCVTMSRKVTRLYEKTREKE